MDIYIVLGSAVVGLLVGLTGAGGGALMTPMLMLVFSVKVPSAISSDLVAAVIMRPVGAAVHFQRRTVNVALVRWLAAGSVPAALGGSYLLHALGRGRSAVSSIETVLGVALLLGAAAMAVRAVMDRRAGPQRWLPITSVAPRRLLTLAIGAGGGLVVGTTSVGAGSLMVVLLLFAYPSIPAGQLVGTDLAQAIPLTGAAALGALLFGPVHIPLTASIVVGAVPAVALGSVLSSRVPDRLLRPVIFLAILASGLRCAGVGDAVLAGGLGVAALTIAALGIGGAVRRRRPGTVLALSCPAGAGKRGDQSPRYRARLFHDHLR